MMIKKNTEASQRYLQTLKAILISISIMNNQQEAVRRLFTLYTLTFLQKEYTTLQYLAHQLAVTVPQTLLQIKFYYDFST